MSFISSLIRTNKKTDTLYKFKKLIEQVLLAQNIIQNLELIYEYISYEQTKCEDFKCIEYFIENEIGHSLVKIPNLEKFFIKVISILSYNYLNKFVTKQVYEYNTDICLIYSERCVVYNITVDMSYLWYLIKNYQNDIQLKNSLVVIFNLDGAIDKLKNVKLKTYLIKILNTTQNEELWIDTYEIYRLYIQKKQKSRKVHALFHDKTIKQDKTYEIPNLHNFIEFREYDKNLYKKEEDTINLYEKSINLYEKVLEIGCDDSLKNSIINTFCDNLQNTPQSIRFLHFLIRNFPFQLSKKIGSSNKTWNVIQVYNKILEKKRFNLSDKYQICFDECTCHMFQYPESVNFYKFFKKEISDTNFCQILLDKKVVDSDIYLFVFVINPSCFFSLFDEISQLIGQCEYFYTTLYKLLIN